MAANQVRKFSSEAELTEFIAKYVADVLSGKESAYHAAEDRLMKRNSALPERADLALEIRADASAMVSFTEPDGSKSAYFDSIADALRRLMWLTERTVSRQLLREHLKQNPPRH